MRSRKLFIPSRHFDAKLISVNTSKSACRCKYLFLTFFRESSRILRFASWRDLSVPPVRETSSLSEISRFRGKDAKELSDSWTMGGFAERWRKKRKANKNVLAFRRFPPGCAREWSALPGEKSVCPAAKRRRQFAV